MENSQCIDPEAIQDWEIEAYADKDPPPHVLEHLEHCPACRARLAEHLSLERHLRQTMYRFDCPSPDLLRDYHWDYVSADERRQVKAHLEICPHCVAELADLAEFVTTERAQSTNDLLDRAREAAAQVRLIVARLVPSVPRPVPALRGETKEVLFFDADDISLSINLEQEDTGAYALFGQVLLPEPVDSSAGSARLTSREERTNPLQVSLGANGVFVFSDLHPGIYQLVVHLSDRRIVVPTLALKAEL